MSTAILEGYSETLGINHWSGHEGTAYITRPEAEFQANAALIAAAPALYEQLSDLISLAELDPEADEVGTDLYTVLMLSREAMAKARGEVAPDA